MNMFLDITMAVLLICAAIADFRTCEVPDAFTLPLVVTACIFGLRQNDIVSVAIAAAVVALILAGAQSSKFGQADWLVYAALVARYGIYSLPVLLLIPATAALANIGTKMLAGTFKRNQSIPFIPFIAVTMPVSHFIITTYWL